MDKKSPKDIQKRTFEFSITIITLTNLLPKTLAGITISKQIIRSGTSIGANIEEAQDGLTKKDFIHSMNISLKEARETLYWLKIIGELKLIPSEIIDKVITENTEIVKILTAIVKKARMS